MSGSFVWTLTSVDIVSGWSEVRPVWNRGQHTTRQGIEAITEAQSFDLKGIDSDNGGEFLNHHLHRWSQEKGIKQSRSRSYRKNGQVHVEQKNYTHVRQLLGYDRLGHQELIEPLTTLLAKWSLFKNLYSVTMEQISKTREGIKEIRRHAKTNRTPELFGQISEAIATDSGKNSRVLQHLHRHFGFYPVAVQADAFSPNQANRAYSQQKGICLSGRALGHPPPTESNRRNQADRSF